jgi:vacuolar ATPase assembly integral membrane protein VMA21
MIIAPLATYFITLNAVFKGNTTLAAVAAVAVTNLVMFSFVVVAYLDDRPSASVASKKST